MKKILKFIKILSVLLVITLVSCNHHHDFIDGLCSCGIYDDSISYNVTFKLDEKTVLSSTTVENGKKVSLPNDPEQVGYQFLGWFNGDAEWNEKDIVRSDLELVAKWEARKYTISFDTDGGCPMDSVTYSYLEEIRPFDIPTKTGYIFAYWDNDIPTNMPNEDLTFKAVWWPYIYTISFNTNGGSLIDSEYYEYGFPVNIEATPTKEGYEFVGWDKEIPQTMPDYDIELNAIWKQVSITLNLDALGGDVNNKAEVEDGEVILPIPLKENYVFKYWYKGLDYTTPIENLTVEDYNNETLYAYYEYDDDNLKSQVVVTLYNNQGESFNELSMYDSSTSDFASLYWHKVGINYVNDEFKVTKIAEHSTQLSTLGDYDYVILAYPNYNKYDEFTELDIKPGYIVKFSKDVSLVEEGKCTLIVSFIAPSIEQEIPLAKALLDNKYSGVTELSDNIDLIQNYETYDITWVSSHPDIITNSGVYYKPTITKDITLTAYILDYKVYELTILVKGLKDESTAISTGYVYTNYKNMNQNAMNQLDIVYCAFLLVDENAEWTNLSNIKKNINNYIYDLAKNANTKIVISVNESSSASFPSIALSEELRVKRVSCLQLIFKSVRNVSLGQSCMKAICDLYLLFLQL